MKWGALLRLAREHQLRLILQIAYFRADNGVPRLASELGESEVAPEVLQHFRDVHHITGIGASAGVEIEVFDRPFEARSRSEYTAAVLKRIQVLDAGPAALFLDPDTGLLPNRASPKHVTPDEVRALWDALRPRDWLVLYQHASRETNWIAKRREAFEAAVPGAHVVQFLSRNGARDVALFAASHRLVGPSARRRAERER